LFDLRTTTVRVVLSAVARVEPKLIFSLLFPFMHPGVLPSDFSRFDVIASGYSTFAPVDTKDSASPPPVHRTDSPLDLESQRPIGKTKKHVDKLTIKVARDVSGRALGSPAGERTPLKSRGHLLRKKSSYDKFDFMDRAYVSYEGAASLPLPLV